MIDTDAADGIFHAYCRGADAMLRNDLGAINDSDVRGLVSLIGHTHIDVA